MRGVFRLYRNRMLEIKEGEGAGGSGGGGGGVPNDSLPQNGKLQEEGKMVSAYFRQLKCYTMLPREETDWRIRCKGIPKRLASALRPRHFFPLSSPPTSSALDPSLPPPEEKEEEEEEKNEMNGPAGEPLVSGWKLGATGGLEMCLRVSSRRLPRHLNTKRLMLVIYLYI